jgi:phosphohistidine swiveling domain-containing protein
MLLFGEIAEHVQKFFGKIYNTSEEISETLHGFSANTWKITGTVKIVLSTKDFYKVHRGDILVTTMTSVDFVPIMEKAGAFVTNEWGITSHAAIVAREMDKPCIIGTKHATRMLKDGDLVEVDADNGVVKILEKKREIQWWFTYDRQMSYQRIELFHCWYCEKLSKYFDVSIENELYRIKNGLVSVFYDEAWHKQAFDKDKMTLLSGKNSKEWYKKMHDTITEDYKKFISFLDKGEEKESRKNLGEELQAYIHQNRDISLSTWLLYGYIEEILSDVLKDLLQKKISSNWEEVFDILSRPDEITPADSWEYDTALACVATGSEKEKETKEIYTKYRSYGMYDVMFEGKTPEAIDKKIEDQSSCGSRDYQRNRK